MFVLVVSLRVKPGKDQQFLAAIDDEAAFQAHRNMPHFPVWRRAAAECVDEQVNTATSLVFPGDG
jgi:hypothetical protein